MEIAAKFLNASVRKLFFALLIALLVMPMDRASHTVLVLEKLTSLIIAESNMLDITCKMKKVTIEAIFNRNSLRIMFVEFHSHTAHRIMFSLAAAQISSLFCRMGLMNSGHTFSILTNAIQLVASSTPMRLLPH
jgi:hypothetical protein